MPVGDRRSRLATRRSRSLLRVTIRSPTPSNWPADVEDRAVPDLSGLEWQVPCCSVKGCESVAGVGDDESAVCGLGGERGRALDLRRVDDDLVAPEEGVEDVAGTFPRSISRLSSA